MMRIYLLPRFGAEIVRIVSTRAKGRCEYCKMHQSLQGATFHVEHVIPKSKGGLTELSNLALACPNCNLHKADSIDGEIDNKIFPRFNPRSDNWNEHFYWDEFASAQKRR